MKPLFTSISILIISFFSLNAQTWNWARAIGNKDVYTTARKVFPLENDETFVVATYNSSQNNILLSRVDSNGNYAWVKLIEGNVSYVGSNIDKSGNVYIVGYTYNPLIKIDNQTFATNSGKNNFVVKLDRENNIQWLKFLDNIIDFNITDFVLTDNNTLIFSGGIPSTNDSIQYHIEVLDSNLNLKADKSIPLKSYVNYAFDKICVDDEMNIYTMGYFSGTLQLSDSLVIELSDTIQYGIFILKMDKNLKVERAISVPNISSLGNIVFNKNHIIISCNKNSFNLLKYDKNLSFIKSYQKEICQLKSNYLTTDENGNLYMASSVFCFDTINFAGQKHNFKHYKFNTIYGQMTSYSNDGMIFKFDENLNEKKLWVIGNELVDEVQYIHVMNDNHFLCCGSFNSESVKIGETVLLNPSPINISNIHTIFNVTKSLFAFFTSYGQSNPSTSLNNRQSLPITLFPNPASSFINIRWAEAAKEIGRLDIYAVDGRWLSAEYIFPGQQQHQVNVEQLVPGTYFITLNINGNVSTAQWIKH